MHHARSNGDEIWNEAKLDVFWSGTQAEYLHLDEISGRAIKAVDAELPVGGPASAAVGWIDELLAAAATTGAPLDFLSTHSYGNAPLDLRPIAARHGRPDLDLWWTEWGAHAGHCNRAHDSVWSTAYLARGMVSAMGRIDALAYWTVSDHFEELGRPPSFLHGGCGLLAVDNVRKPRWWALWMLEQLLDDRVDVRAEGDGTGTWSTRSPRPAGRSRGDRRAQRTVDVSKVDGDELLDRDVELTVTGLREGRYRLRHHRLDEQHSNLNRTWAEIAGGRAWPTEADWQTLHDADHLAELEPPSVVATDAGVLRLEYALPMPALSLVELEQVSPTDD